MRAEGNDVADHGMLTIFGDVQAVVLLALGIAEDNQHFAESLRPAEGRIAAIFHDTAGS